MRSVRSAFVWMGAGQFLTVASQFAAQIVLARYLSVHDAGIYAFALSVVALISLIQAVGLKALIIREEVVTPAIEATAYTVNGAITLLLSFAILLFSLFGGVFLGEPAVGRVLLAMAVTPLFSIFFFLPAARLERDGHFATIAAIGVASAMAGAGATIVLAIHGWSYMSVPYGQWVSGGVTLLLFIAVGARFFRLRPSLEAWRRIGGFGMQMLAIAGVNTASARLSEVFLARIQGLTAMGLFFRASSFNTVLWVNLHTLIGRVMLVDFARLHREGISLRDRYLQGLNMITALLWPIFAGGAVLAAPALRLVFGEKWVAAAPALSLVLIASMVNISISMTWEVFAAKDQLRILTRIEYIRAGLTFLLFIAACFVSLEAAAATRIIDGMLAIWFYSPHLHRMTETTGQDFLRCYRRSLLLTILACLPALACILLWENPAHLPVTVIAGAIGAGLFLWLAGLRFLRHPLLEQIARFSPVRLRKTC